MADVNDFLNNLFSRPQDPNAYKGVDAAGQVSQGAPAPMDSLPTPAPAPVMTPNPDMVQPSSLSMPAESVAPMTPNPDMEQPQHSQQDITSAMKSMGFNNDQEPVVEGSGKDYSQDEPVSDYQDELEPEEPKKEESKDEDSEDERGPAATNSLPHGPTGPSVIDPKKVVAQPSDVADANQIIKSAGLELKEPDADKLRDAISQYYAAKRMEIGMQGIERMSRAIAGAGHIDTTPVATKGAAGLMGGEEAVAQAQSEQQQYDKGLERQGKQIALKEAKDKSDPSSDISKAYRGLVQQFADQAGMNFKMSDNTSAADIEKLNPTLARFAENKLRMESTADYRNARLQEMGLRRQELQQRQQGLDLQKQQAREDKLKKEDATNTFKVGQQLESVRGNKALQNDMETIRRVQNAAKVVASYKDPNDIPSQIVSQLNLDLGNIISGGVVGEGLFKEIGTPTAYSGMARLAQKLFNHPTGANAAAFVSQNQKLLRDLGDNAQTRVDDRYRRVMNSVGKTLSPDAKTAFQAQYLPNDVLDKAGNFGRPPVKKVKVMQSNGMIGSIPEDKVQEAISRGAKVLTGQ